MKFAGHLGRMNLDSPTSINFRSNPIRSRARGRPKKDGLTVSTRISNFKGQELETCFQFKIKMDGDSKKCLVPQGAVESIKKKK